MANEVELTQARLDNLLGKSFDNASSIITKDYLDKLENYKIINPSEEDIDIDISECGKFYKLTKLVLNKEENFLDKLTTIVNVVSSIDCSLATIIKSNGFKIDYYLGIISKNSRDSKEISVKRRLADATAFKGALLGNLTGSELEEVPKSEVNDFRNKILVRKNSCYSSVSGVVALRNQDDKSIEGYVQGIENLVDSLKGQKYTVVMLADPVNTSIIQATKHGYEMLYTQLSTFAKSSLTYNQTESLSLSKAKTEGISNGIAEGIALTQSKSRSNGKSFGVGANLGVSFIISAGVNFNASTNSSFSETSGRTNTTTKTNQYSHSETNTASNSESTGKSLQLNYENRRVQTLLDKIDKQLERLDDCESFGAFDCATYVIAEDRSVVLTVASNYNALMRGKNSSIQASHINLWHRPEDTNIIGKYIGSLVHPRFYQNEDKSVIVTPASIVNGDEIAIQIGLPKKSVNGITVIPMAPFGRNVVENNLNSIEIGKLYHMGHNEGTNSMTQKVSIDVESLAMHTFITGSTGSGKSTAIYSILDKLIEKNVRGSKDKKIKFMVIEPAKGEYKDRFGSYSNVSVYGTNYKKMPLLKINPFSFPEDIHILEHIDRLIEIFNVCWPMYAAMPAVLKDSIERAYSVAGWDLDTSECKYVDAKGQPLYPTFIDVLNQINVAMDESQYSSDSKGDYKGALCTRLKSLTNGLYGQIFTNDEIPANKLFDENVIIDLSRTGSSETKSLIMGLLVMKLQEYRMANSKAGNEPLKHITVLEEAHNILKRTYTEQPTEGANMLGKSVEMLANSIAEMRTYGEGFIIADQSPGLMDMSVIRNTNTKIILRLPDLGDRQLVGSSANLNDDQIQEISRLKTFVAAVYQNNWLEPVLCNIDTNFKSTAKYSYSNNELNKEQSDKIEIIRYLLASKKVTAGLKKEYIESLCDKILRLSIPAEAKVSFIKYVSSKQNSEITANRETVIYYIFNSELAFNLSKIKKDNFKIWYSSMLENLEPNITSFNEKDQQKLLSILTKVNMSIDKTNESKEIFYKVLNIEKKR